MNRSNTNSAKLPYAFISYKHANGENSLKAIRTLQSAGYRVWFDNELEPGTRYNKKIAKKIKHCSVFICLLTSEYGKSDYCMLEFNYAIKKLNKPCIPIILGMMSDIRPCLEDEVQMVLASYESIEWQFPWNTQALLEDLSKNSALEKCKNASSASMKSADDNYKQALDYYYGHRVQKNKITAAEYFKKAADMGHVKSMFNYAVMVHSGIDVPKGDIKLAISYYKSAADKGHEKAMFKLAKIYENNESVKDLSEAAKWYWRSAETGNTTAMIHLKQLVDDLISNFQGVSMPSKDKRKE